MRSLFILSLTLILLFSGACNEKGQVTAIDASALLHNNEKKLTEVIIYDVFSPPVANRIFIQS